jgi:intracellular sulfur oxidation DsrE/DsrF family protein
MTSRSTHSSERVSAFVDGELDAAERERFLETMDADPELGEAVHETRRLQDLVRHAYNEPAPAPALRDAAGARRPRRRTATVAAVLGAGIAVGWLAHGQLQGATGIQEEQAFALHLESAGEQIPVDAGGAIIHLSSADPGQINAALDRAEALVREYRDSRPGARVELLVNGAGLDLLRADTSPAAMRIRAMQHDYGNLTFMACRKALERFELTHGTQAHLLDGTTVAPSALDQILTRLRQGWTYVHI